MRTSEGFMTLGGGRRDAGQARRMTSDAQCRTGEAHGRLGAGQVQGRMVHLNTGAICKTDKLPKGVARGGSRGSVEPLFLIQQSVHSLYGDQ